MLQNSPGEFQRGMFIDVPVLTDLQAIQRGQQAVIDSNLAKQNQK